MACAASAATVLSRRSALVVTVAIGALLRAVAALDHPSRVSADQRSYALLALHLSENARYGGTGVAGALHWPPGAPALFALANLFDPARISLRHPDVPAAYVAQVVVGTATIVVVAAIADAIAGRLAALLAALLVALYPPLILSAGELLSEPLGALLLACAVWAVAAGVRERREGLLIAGGVLLGLTILTRADLLLAPLAAAGVVVALSRAEGRRAAARRGGIVLAAAALTLAPWTLLASLHERTFVPVTTGGGSNLFVGTYLPGHGTLFGLKHALGPATRAARPVLAHVRISHIPEQDIISYVARGHYGRREDAFLRGRGLHDLVHYATQRPAAYAGMLVAKVGRLWLNYTRGATLHGSPAPLRAAHILLMVLALAGLALGIRRRRDAALVLVAALLGLVTVVNALLVSEARHLLPLLPLLFAAGAAGAVLHRAGR